jgi:hypothetical protein
MNPQFIPEEKDKRFKDSGKLKEKSNPVEAPTLFKSIAAPTLF